MNFLSIVIGIHFNMYLLLAFVSLLVGFYVGIIFKEQDIDTYRHMYKKLKEELLDKNHEIEARDKLIESLMKDK